MSSTVKRLKSIPSSTVYADQVDRAKAWRKNRDALGETFGTRKAKSQIKAEERNKVDVAAMEGVKGHLLGSIAERAVAEGTSFLFAVSSHDRLRDRPRGRAGAACRTRMAWPS